MSRHTITIDLRGVSEADAQRIAEYAVRGAGTAHVEAIKVSRNIKPVHVPTVTYYFAGLDENGVFVVAEMWEESTWTPEKIASMAKANPDTIYFTVGKYHCLTYQCGLCDGCRVAEQEDPSGYIVPKQVP